MDRSEALALLVSKGRRGDKPGHPFRGNQWTNDMRKVVRGIEHAVDAADRAKLEPGVRERPRADLAESRLIRLHAKKRWHVHNPYVVRAIESDQKGFFLRYGLEDMTEDQKVRFIDRLVRVVPREKSEFRVRSNTQSRRDYLRSGGLEEFDPERQKATYVIPVKYINLVAAEMKVKRKRKPRAKKPKQNVHFEAPTAEDSNKVWEDAMRGVAQRLSDEELNREKTKLLRAVRPGRRERTDHKPVVEELTEEQKEKNASTDAARNLAIRLRILEEEEERRVKASKKKKGKRGPVEKSIFGSRLRALTAARSAVKWSEAKHKRGRGGRFTETPDAPKAHAPSRPNLSPAERQRARAKADNQELKDTISYARQAQQDHRKELKRLIEELDAEINGGKKKTPAKKRAPAKPKAEKVDAPEAPDEPKADAPDAKKKVKDVAERVDPVKAAKKPMAKRKGESAADYLDRGGDLLEGGEGTDKWLFQGKNPPQRKGLKKPKPDQLGLDPERFDVEDMDESSLNAVYVVTDKKSGKKYVLKNTGSYQESLNEVLGSKVYQRLGLKAPKTKILRSGKTGNWTLQEHLGDDFHSASQKPDDFGKLMQKPEVRDQALSMFMMDVIFGNDDRHLGNVGMSGGQLNPIDHGFTTLQDPPTEMFGKNNTGRAIKGLNKAWADISDDDLSRVLEGVLQTTDDLDDIYDEILSEKKLSKEEMEQLAGAIADMKDTADWIVEGEDNMAAFMKGFGL